MGVPTIGRGVRGRGMVEGAHRVHRNREVRTDLGIAGLERRPRVDVLRGHRSVLFNGSDGGCSHPPPVPSMQSSSMPFSHVVCGASNQFPRGKEEGVLFYGFFPPHTTKNPIL